MFSHFPALILLLWTEGPRLWLTVQQVVKGWFSWRVPTEPSCPPPDLTGLLLTPPSVITNPLVFCFVEAIWSPHSPWFKFLFWLAHLHYLSIILFASPGSLKESGNLCGNMDCRRSALLLLFLCLQRTVLEVRGQKRGYLQEALRALNLPLRTGEEPQLQKNHTGVLITTLLQAVHCPERTGTSQDICDKVRSTPVFILSFECYCIILNF